MLALIPQLQTVTGASGRPGQIVGWVRDAWIDLQNERNDWVFRRQRAEKTLTINQTTYTKLNFALDRLARFMPDYGDYRTVSIYDNAIGRTDEGALNFMAYERWLDMYDFRTHQANRPRDWSMSPQRELLVGPKPDKAYKIRFRYITTPQVLEDDNDEPEAPEEFHRVIVFEAIRLMARSDEAFATLQVDADEYVRLRSGLVIDQTPNLTTM